MFCPLEHPKESDRQVVKTVSAGAAVFKERDRQGAVPSAKKVECALLGPAWVPAGSPVSALPSATLPDDGRASSHTGMCNVAFGRFLFLQSRGAPGRQQLPRHVSISPNFTAAETFMTFPCVPGRIVLAPGAAEGVGDPHRPCSCSRSPSPSRTDSRHSSPSFS